MEANSENRLIVSTAAEAAPERALVRPAGEGPESEDAEAGHQERLSRLGMRLDIVVRVPAFCVRDLLALERGTVLETEHDHTQDVPMRSGGALLAWAEFEVVNEGLAVRLTRLA